ncbi:MAG: hypothetical protein IIX34_01940 [Alistipes sp.]|nr:hypothetical protein [Alistipes sp.]
MRNRYSFFKFTIGRWKHKTMEDVNRELNVTFTKAEILGLICMALIFVAIAIPHEVISGVVALIAMICYTIATIWDCFYYNPITRWRHATTKSAIAATLWLVMPIILYYAGEQNAEEKRDMIIISISSVVMWIAFFISLYKWISNRREARARAAAIDMKIRTRRKTAIGY